MLYAYLSIGVGFMTLQWRRVLVFRSRDAQYQKYPTIIYRHRNRPTAISVYRGISWSRQYSTQLHQNSKNSKDKDTRKMYALQAATLPNLSRLLKSDGVCLTVEYACCCQAAAGRRPKSTKSIAPHRLWSLNKAVQQRAHLPNWSAHSRRRWNDLRPISTADIIFLLPEYRGIYQSYGIEYRYLWYRGISVIPVYHAPYSVAARRALTGGWYVAEIVTNKRCFPGAWHPSQTQ